MTLFCYIINVFIVYRVWQTHQSEILQDVGNHTFIKLGFFAKIYEELIRKPYHEVSRIQRHKDFRLAWHRPLHPPDFLREGRCVP